MSYVKALNTGIKVIVGGAVTGLVAAYLGSLVADTLKGYTDSFHSQHEPVLVVIDLDPPDRGAPPITGDGGTRMKGSEETPDLTGRGRPGDRRSGGSKNQDPFVPKDNGGPGSSQGSGTRFNNA